VLFIDTQQTLHNWPNAGSIVARNCSTVLWHTVHGQKAANAGRREYAVSAAIRIGPMTARCRHAAGYRARGLVGLHARHCGMHSRAVDITDEIAILTRSIVYAVDVGKSQSRFFEFSVGVCLV
jgi:hypothetical protein